MSVLIKGMKMPKNCLECAARFGKICGQRIYGDMRECALVELPTPHGRLIDGDVLEGLIYERISDLDYKADAFDILRIVQDMSTMIEAEEDVGVNE